MRHGQERDEPRAESRTPIVGLVRIEEVAGDLFERGLQEIVSAPNPMIVTQNKEGRVRMLRRLQHGVVTAADAASADGGHDYEETARMISASIDEFIYLIQVCAQAWTEKGTDVG